MKREISRNIKLGVFVIAGLALLISALYMIGSKRNLFSSSIKVNVIFHNINGLMDGNNVRFNGIDIGTVSKIEIVSDTTIHVQLTIDKSVSKFISSNSIASIGTDGLMGNKLVNISPGTTGNGKSLEEGTTLASLKPIDIDEALRTLNKTNDNLQFITNDVKIIAKRFSSKNTLWSILLDSNMAKNLQQSVTNINAATKDVSGFAKNLNNTMINIKNGNGTLGKLLTDTAMSSKINDAITNFNQGGKNVVTITNDLNSLVRNTKNGKGSLGYLLKDTTLSHNLNSAALSIDKGAKGFNDNMEALKHNFFFRRYFRDKEKDKK